MIGSRLKLSRYGLVVLILFAALTSFSFVDLKKKQTDSAVAFHDAMRKLWEDHVTWTRLYIVSAVAGLPDQGATAERLLKNQEDIGDAIRPYYGDEAGDALPELLK